MSNRLEISSYTGTYSVDFVSNPFSVMADFDSEDHFYIIDRNVYNLYEQQFKKVKSLKKMIFIDATEENKNFNLVDKYIDQLLELNIKRNHNLVAIGGGITQDITCFIASVLYRGIDWFFFPTTLLAQADSCIGSKSSINYKSYKNLLGTFTPPNKIFLSVAFQDTLSGDEIKSGIGEIFKVHLIDGVETYRSMIIDYDKFHESEIMLKHLIKSLEIKKKIIEVDEFDKNIRNVMNYGHSFGHAIESATNFGIPHGIAVTIGIDLANFLSFKKGNISKELYQELKVGVQKNYRGYQNFDIPFIPFIEALSKDKKNTSESYGLILFNKSEKIEKQFFDRNKDDIENICEEFFTKEFY